jgi:glutamyl-tRNA synthetase
VYYDYLSRREFMDDNVPFEEQVNFDSKHQVPAFGDFNLKSLKKGDRLQLERIGYFIVDQPFESNDKEIVLINIPDSLGKK